MGLKSFVLGVTIAVCCWALVLSQPFQIVAAVFCIVGCALYLLDK